MTDRAGPANMAPRRPVQFLVAAQVLSQLGDQVNRVALIALLWAGQRPASAELVALLSIAGLPALALGYFAGLLADRYPSRWLLVVSDLGRAVLVLAMPVLFALTGSSAAIYALLPLVLALNRVFRIARGRLLPDWVGDVRRANAVLTGADRAAEIGGAAVAGLLVAGLGWRWGFAADALTYLASAAVLLAMPVGGSGRNEPRDVSVPAKARSRRSASLGGAEPSLAILAAALAPAIVAGIAGLVVPGFLDGMHVTYGDRTPLVTGFLMAALAAGSALGSVALARTPVGIVWVALAPVVIGVAGVAALAMTSVAMRSGLALFAGLGATLVLVGAETWIQENALRRRLGRWLAVKETLEKGAFLAGLACGIAAPAVARDPRALIGTASLLALASIALVVIEWRRRGELGGYGVLTLLWTTTFCVKWLPLGTAERLATRVGRHTKRWHGHAARAVSANQRSFGVEASLDALLTSYARYHVEAAAIGAGKLDELVRRVRIEGWEHLEHARRQGRGVVFLTAHVGNWDLLAATLARRCGGGLVWAERLRPAALFEHYAALRRRGGVRVVTGPWGMREALAALRKGACVGFVGDRPQDGARATIQLDQTRLDLPLGPYRLARRAGVAIIPAMLVRREGGYVLRIGVPLGALGSTGETEAGLHGAATGGTETLLATEFAGHVRAWVRSAPEQWLMFSPIVVDA